MTLRDTPRPDGYWPGTPSQWEEPTVDDCTWYAVEFGFEAASETHRSVHPVQGLRQFSSDTVGGTPIHVAIREANRLWPTSERVHAEYGSYDRADIERFLKAGATIIWGGDYEKLPPHYRKWTNNDVFDHAMASRGFRSFNGGQTFLYDPLGGGPLRLRYDGEWISIDALLTFNWHAGTSRYWLGVIENEGDEPLRTINVFPNHPADKEVRVRNATAVRAQPRETGERTRGFYNEDKWWPLLGNGGGGFKLIGWNLDQSNRNIGYVHTDDIIETRAVTLTEVDSDALKLANAALRTENTNLQNQLSRYGDFVDDIRESVAALP
jgi:hypothetical protein